MRTGVLMRDTTKEEAKMINLLKGKWLIRGFSQEQQPRNDRGPALKGWTPFSAPDAAQQLRKPSV